MNHRYYLGLIAIVLFLSGCVSGYSPSEIREQFTRVHFKNDGNEKAAEMIELASMLIDSPLKPADPLISAANDYFIAELKSPDKLCRAGAIRALAITHPENSDEAVILLLKDDQEIVQESALNFILEHPTEKSVPHLGNFMKTSKTPHMLSLAIRALGAVGSESAVGALIESLDSLGESSTGELQLACMTLAGLTNQNFGINRSKWKQWWKTKPSETSKD